MCNLMQFPEHSYCVNQDTPATGDSKEQKPGAGEAADLRSNSPGRREVPGTVRTQQGRENTLKRT